jgi:hypothetical protein
MSIEEESEEALQDFQNIYEALQDLALYEDKAAQASYALSDSSSNVEFEALLRHRENYDRTAFGMRQALIMLLGEEGYMEARQAFDESQENDEECQGECAHCEGHQEPKAKPN